MQGITIQTIVVCFVSNQEKTINHFKYVEWIPFHVLRFYRFFKAHIKLLYFFHWLTYRLLLMYPVVNPVVYYIHTFNKEYRQSFWELLCCPRSCVNTCHDSFHLSEPPQDENNVHNAERVTNDMESFELQEQVKQHCGLILLTLIFVLSFDIHFMHFLLSIQLKYQGLHKL